MTSPIEQYYEGGAPRSKARRWLYAGGAVVVVLLLILFAKSTLPARREEFVGKWTCAVKPWLFYEFRPDGTYSAIDVEDWIGGNQSVRVKSSGKWRATKDVLYLTTEKMEAVDKLRHKSGFNGEVKARIGLERRLPIEWGSPTQWRLHWGSSNYFERER